MEKSEIIRVFENAKISANSKSYNIGIDYRGNIVNILGFICGDGDIIDIATLSELNEVCDFCESVCNNHKDLSYHIKRQKMNDGYIWTAHITAKLTRKKIIRDGRW